MSNLTINGHVFEVEDDPNIVEGAPMSAGHVHSLQQTRRENVRNNFASKVKERQGEDGSLGDAEKAELQSALADYAAKYEFGVRQAGTARRVVDPVEKEMLRMARDDISAAYFAKNGEKLKGEALANAAEQLLSVRGDDYAKRARRAIREREAAAAEVLNSIAA